ncbi:MAG: exodeoxyribonuclease V subunit beta [Colwellia sp.]
MKLLNLEAATIPLSGKHLIEASAGTGKTYNITRIYLRLLLERELTVQQILLMTFTKDATQELRGRIDTFLRDALENWDMLCDRDEYFNILNSRISCEQREFILKRALLFLDEAAIFTIHGFCQRALTQHAFASGLSFNANMSTDSRLLALEACQDWYRQLAKQAGHSFSLVVKFWSDPDKFMSSFSKAITHETAITTNSPQNIIQQLVVIASRALTSIKENQQYLQDSLISHKSADETQKRSEELKHLLSFLEGLANNHNKALEEQDLRELVKQGIPKYLLNGNRHPKAAKAKIKLILSPCKTLETSLSKFANNIDKAKAYEVVQLGIYQIRKQVIHKKQLLNTLDFDDLINTLAHCVEPNENGEQTALAKALLAQFPVALIDEFQDTDPKQFAILKGIYYHGNRAVNTLSESKQVDNISSHTTPSEIALYLIGDPKQAIYGFRGGDVFAYLSARAGCDYHWLMDTNWRSTPSIINAYNQIFSGCSISKDKTDDNQVAPKTAVDAMNDSVFGYGIPYQKVNAGKRTNNLSIATQLAQESKDKAFHFVHFEPEKDKTAQAQRPLMAKWCANEVALLLKDQIDQSSTNISPKDIAILVRDSAEGQAIKQALLAANIPSVFLSDRSNLFESEQAKQISLLLKGIIYPEDERCFLPAITCGLLGFDLHNLYNLQHDEIAYQTLHFDFVDYREQWINKGFISMAIALMHRHLKVPNANKDRVLTNVLHLFELLQLANQRFLQPQELLYWFDQQCDTQGNSAEVEIELRLENDGDLVRIITQHGSKGLEYPVVFIPFASRFRNPLKFGNKEVSYIEYHNEENELVLSLDGDENAKSRMANESYAETIRLLYVAITRAERKCYIFTTPFDDYALSPLGQTLQWSKEEDIPQSLRRISAQAPNDISFDSVSLDELNDQLADMYNESTAQNKEQLSEDICYQASKFDGHIERDWWLSSFTALSKKLRHDGKSAPNRDSHLIEDTLDEIQSKIDETEEANLLRFQIQKGAQTGNFLHALLEYTDFQQKDWQVQVKAQSAIFNELAPQYTLENLNNWLDDIMHCPLSESHLDPGFCLQDIPQENKLKEVEFYFPMANASSNRLTQLLIEHRENGFKKSCSQLNNAGAQSLEVLKERGHVNRVRLPSYASLKGMMHGFIDLVFEHQGKYYLCDYKSSHLGNHFEAYSGDALHENIEKNHYDLQYLIYSVALHRYLKTSLNDYDPEIHFGGSYYLYLRGMKRERIETTQGYQHGVYFRQISVETLDAFDTLFSGETPNNLSDELLTPCNPYSNEEL